MEHATHPFQIPNFRAYVVSRFAKMLAQYAMLLIIGWQTYNIARDGGMTVGEASGQLALIGLLQFVPLFLLTPLTGLVADLFNRRNLARLTLLGQIACALTLAIATSQDAISLPLLWGVAVVLGIVRAFAGPAYSALAPNLVPPRLLPTAIALSSIAWQTGMIAGPAMGGYLYVVDPALPYAIATALYVAALIGITMIKNLPPRQPTPKAPPLAQIRDGLAYVGQNRMVLSTITLDLLAVFLAGATALFPVFARDILQVGATGLSQLAMAPAVGAAATAILFSVRPLKNNVGPMMLVAVAIFGFATIGFAFSRSMPLSLALLFVVGAADMFSVYIRQSLIQLHTPDEKRGRVSAVSQLTISASNEGGDAFSGSLALAIGPIAAVALGGIGAVATVAMWAWLFPVLRKTKTFDPPANVLEASPKPSTEPDRQES
ncbi:putative transmembrane protein [Aurantiacibacter gangjinensis]|uniref:MFS transporter n=2 Tax=Aurantiacibacter gangjinensis TaxID=502682 RepID=A0A0G9MQA3_9SPHN|nr:MFS transporter [Aurantiacibacter gangjinensis]APE28729.1 putative transmembrane protein [Aurantiacibacter gangjinensis]KLE32890.1 MFS transporter [Aurantiacibacter gangjinensis]